MPIIGRLLRWSAENMTHSESKGRKPVRADGHFGQIIPLEDAKVILGDLAAEPMIENYCMCRWMHRGIKECCCINLSPVGDNREAPAFHTQEQYGNNTVTTLSGLAGMRPWSGPREAQPQGLCGIGLVPASSWSGHPSAQGV